MPRFAITKAYRRGPWSRKRVDLELKSRARSKAYINLSQIYYIIIKQKAISYGEPK